MHEHIELLDKYKYYIEDNIEKALENFYKAWEIKQKEYDALPWYKKWFRDNPFYNATQDKLSSELCVSNCAVFINQCMEEDKLLTLQNYFRGCYPTKCLDMDDYYLIRWWAEYDFSDKRTD